jgi:hypothetical protein
MHIRIRLFTWCGSRFGSDFYFDADPDPGICNKWPKDPTRVHCEPSHLPAFDFDAVPDLASIFMWIRLRRPKLMRIKTVEICGTEFRVINDLWESPFQKIYDMLRLRQICKTAGINLRNFGNAHTICLLWITICRRTVLCNTVSSFRGSQLHDICLFEQSLFTSFYR